MANESLREAVKHLPRLAVFVELARLGSFRGAAEALGLSPSTVSHHIRALEEALHVRLVQRTSRAIALTAAGEGLLVEAKEILASWDRGSRRARSFAESPGGTLVVTAPDVIADGIVAPAMQIMLERHPAVRVDCRVDARNLDLLDEGIDVAIRRGPLADSSFGARLLHDGTYGIFAAPAVVQRWPVVHPVDLEHVPWVQFTQRGRSLELVHASSPATVVAASEVRASVSTGATFIRFVAAGIGFGVVPRELVRSQVDAGELVDVLPEWSAGRVAFYAVTPSPKMFDAKVTLFVELLLEAFRGDGPDAP
ncbi:MAG: LysR family transcriptional regulator [Myxococcales bacterium]|nr:LysR family transcriptional regulator [Myxococcales bacterium]